MRLKNPSSRGQHARTQHSWPRAAGVPLWAMLSALSVLFALSHAYRTLPTVIAGQLQQQLTLSEQQLGAFAGVFHLAFGAVQLAAGVAVDLYGPKRTVAWSFVAAIAGALICASSERFVILLAGQALVGIGCAPVLLAIMVFVAERYPRNQFARLSGLTLGAGGMGMLLTGTPLAWVVESWSWRVGFLLLALISIVAWAVALMLVDDGRGGARRQEAAFGEAWRQVGLLLLLKQTAGVLMLGAITYSAFLALRGLWIAPLLQTQHGLSLIESGHVIFGASLAALFGPPLFGALDPGGRSRRLWIVTAAAVFAVLFVALASSSSTSAVVAIFLGSSLLAGFITLQYADVRSSYPDNMAGRALALFNTAMFLGVALTQWATGAVAAAASERGSNAFAAVFLTLAALLALGATGFYLLPWPDSLPRRGKR